MDLLLKALLVFIAISHIGFMVLEMLLWDKALGRKIFGLDESFARSTKALAANQGLYNGFLAAGLFWGLIADWFAVQLFFLSCVFIAGVFGAMTVNTRIFWVQAFPAMLALLLLFR